MHSQLGLIVAGLALDHTSASPELLVFIMGIVCCVLTTLWALYFFVLLREIPTEESLTIPNG